MRDARILKHGLSEYRLLPTFEVIEAFEERHGSLMAHLIALVEGNATVHHRATLLLEAARAGFKDAGKPFNWDIRSTMKMVFDLGVADEAQVALEADLCKALLYTPEQYAEKKAQAEAEAERQKQLADLLNAFDPASAPPSQS